LQILFAFKAFAQTHNLRVSPLGSRTCTCCTFGLKRRFVTLTTWVPMPPLFLATPRLRMREPAHGRFPVIAQILDMAPNLPQGGKPLFDKGRSIGRTVNGFL
jgi:hypothetical protein